jgi:hypothetical protein
VAKNVGVWRIFWTSKRNIVADGSAAISFTGAESYWKSPYSAIASPEPPNPAGKSLNFG